MKKRVFKRVFRFYRGIAVGIYTTNSPEACFHCLDDSRANIVVVQDAKQLEKIEAIKSRLPHLKAIVQYEGCPIGDGVLSVMYDSIDCALFKTILFRFYSGRMCWISGMNKVTICWTNESRRSL